MNKDEALDSITHHEERAAKMRAEAEAAARKAMAAEEDRRVQQTERNRVERHAQADELETRVGIIREGETREMLLDRIRKLREDVPAEPVYEYYSSPEQLAQLEREQKAGREAVAAAEAREAQYREARLKAEAEEQASKAVMVPVHHPNPGQNEIFPTVKSTLPGSTTRKK